MDCVCTTTTYASQATQAGGLASYKTSTAPTVPGGGLTGKAAPSSQKHAPLLICSGCRVVRCASRESRAGSLRR
jgi:hypothetical protein